MGDKLAPDTFETYLKLVSRSLLVWQNVFLEIAEGLNEVDAVKSTKLSQLFQSIRDDLPIKHDVPVPGADELLNELERACLVLHKKIHALPNREPMHRAAREIEQILRDYRITISR